MSKKRNNIDIGLAVLCTISEEGETLSFAEIAEVCGCNKSYIQRLSDSAIKKLKNKRVLQQYFMDGL